MRIISLAALAVLGLAAVPASADPLGLVDITLSGGGVSSCAAPSVSFSGRVEIAGALPGRGLTVQLRVNGQAATFVSTDETGAFQGTVDAFEVGTLSVTARVLSDTVLQTESDPVSVEGTARQLWVDMDGDGFGAAGTDPICADTERPGWTDNEGDCDDTDPRVYPGAYDPPSDGIDWNCDTFD